MTTPKSWMIIGASRGIGLALVATLLERGDRVIAGIRPGRSGELPALAKRFQEQLTIVDCDVRNSEQVAAAAEIAGDAGCEAAVFNGAVYGQRSPSLFQTDEQDRLATIDTNALGFLRLAKHVGPRLAGTAPRLVAITSLMGKPDNPGANDLPYRVSKGALNRLVTAIAQELKGRGLTTVAMRPGWVRTEMGGPRGKLSPEESADGLISAIDALTLADAGKLLDYTGEELGW